MGLPDPSITDYVGAIVAIVALAAGLYFSFRETRRFRRELRERTYFEYTGRYQEIRTHLPSNVFSDDFVLEELSTNDEYRRWLRAYFDLCTEEVKLQVRDMIDPEEWRNWTEGICANMASRAAAWAWSNLHLEEYTTLRLFLEGSPPPLTTTVHTIDTAEVIARVESAIKRHSQNGHVAREPVLAEIETIVVAEKQELSRILRSVFTDEPYTEWELEATARAMVWLGWTIWVWTSKAERSTTPDRRAKVMGPALDRVLMDTARAGRIIG